MGVFCHEPDHCTDDNQKQENTLGTHSWFLPEVIDLKIIVQKNKPRSTSGAAGFSVHLLDVFRVLSKLVPAANRPHPLAPFWFSLCSMLPD
jgi:hypothetical protein